MTRIEHGTVVLTTGSHADADAPNTIVLDALLQYLTDHGMIGEVSDGQ